MPRVSDTFEDRAGHVVVAGGGIAGLELLLGLHELAGDSISLELISPSRDFVYGPFSVTEPFNGTPAPVFDIGTILAGTGITNTVGSVERVETMSNEVALSGGECIAYDALAITIGAKKVIPLENAITFTGPGSADSLKSLLSDVEAGTVSDLAFVVPSGATWPLPAYELALLTASWLRDREIAAQITVVTPETLPLRMFGLKASREVSHLLHAHDVGLVTSAPAATYDGEVLSLVTGSRLTAQRVVTIPTLVGPAVDGLAHDGQGFLRTDGHGLVENTLSVYAAGDGTSFPIKQGTIAAQQADAVAHAIAARFVDGIEDHGFRPVVKGLLISPEGPLFMQAEIAGDHGVDFSVSNEPLWHRGGKSPGEHLSRRLNELEPAETVQQVAT